MPWPPRQPLDRHISPYNPAPYRRAHARPIVPRVAIANSLWSQHTEELAFLPEPLAPSSRSPPAASRIVIATKNRIFQQYPLKADMSLHRSEMSRCAISGIRGPGRAMKLRAIFQGDFRADLVRRRAPEAFATCMWTASAPDNAARIQVDEPKARSVDCGICSLHLAPEVTCTR
jgi:hypothetical protein